MALTAGARPSDTVVASVAHDRSALKRMLGFQGPAQPSPTLGDAISAGFGYLEVKCLGCETHSTVDLTTLRRPKATPVHELERRMRCRQCSELRGNPYKRSRLVALRATKISATDPASTWRAGPGNLHKTISGVSA